MKYGQIGQTVFEMTGRILSETELDALGEAYLLAMCATSNPPPAYVSGISPKYLLRTIVTRGQRMREKQRDAQSTTLAIVKKQRMATEQAFDAILELCLSQSEK